MTVGGVCKTVVISTVGGVCMTVGVVCKTSYIYCRRGV